ncbi:MAG: M48 family metalloprotease [Gaiellaceae bacterium MAG52_C11]|nr:M48 family metalloprotease [Candidatus Gaiellasilicea maunaloa]
MSGVGSTEPTESAAPPRPRLNPFVFPSETTFRFGLLVTAVLGASLYVWNWISTVVADPAEEVAEFRACFVLSPLVTGVTDVDEFSAASDAFTACLNAANRDVLWWMLGGTAGLVALTIAFVLAAPRWIERRRRLEPLTEEEAPAVRARLRELVREAGLDEEPRFLWNPLDQTATGLAYGYAGTYSVALTGGLVIRQIADPPAFDAVVRHELAHIRNRDVAITYATVALWYAFLVAAVAPFFLTLLDDGGDGLSNLSWRVVALAALVYGTRNSVLRSREVYADVRASAGEGRRGGLRRVLGSLRKPVGGVFARLRRLHPDPAVRLAALDDTRPLFRFSPLVAFGSGVAATIAYENVVTLVSFFVDDPIDMRFVAALAFAPFAVGIVGYGIWRATFAAVAEGGTGIPTVKIGLALAAGFLVGPELSLAQFIVTDDDALLASLLRGNDFPWGAALVLGLVLFSGWLGTVASYWARSLGDRRPQIPAFLTLLAGSAVLSAFMGVFYVARDTREAIDFSTKGSALQHAAVAETAWAGPVWLWQALLDPAFLVVAQRPFIPPALALLCAVPLAAVLVGGGRRDGVTDWAFLDPGGQLRPSRLGLDVVRPLAIGLGAGLAFWALLLVLRFSLHNGVSAETRATDAFLLSFYFWTLVLALAAQLAAGALAAFLSRNPNRLVDALAAGFVAGSLATLGIVGGPSVASCIDPIALNPAPCAWTVSASFSWDVFRQVVAQGALGSLAGGGLALGLRAWLDRRRADELSAAGVPG